jgi:hypothetical protein
MPFGSQRPKTRVDVKAAELGSIRNGLVSVFACYETELLSLPSN